MSDAVERGEPGEGARRRDGLLTTGAMARLARCTLRTVRFYEETGLLEPVQRTQGGHRLYGRAALERLRLVTGLRAAGFSLDEVRDLLGAKARGTSGALAAAGLVARLDRHIADLTERAALLQSLAAELTAARGALHACTRCERPDLFPDHCSSCQVMRGAEPLSAAVTVLWGVER